MRINDGPEETEIPPTMSLDTGGDNLVLCCCYIDPPLINYGVTGPPEGD